MPSYEEDAEHFASVGFTVAGVLVTGFVLFVVGMLVFFFGFVIPSLTAEQERMTACSDVCHPLKWKMIERDCHCATESGWLRQDG